MTASAIEISNLGKRYRLGVRREPYFTLRDGLVHATRAPLRWIRGARNGAASTPSETEWLWALRSVSFDVEPGEVVGIIGRNGSGKSTLLKILSRITEPTEGRARVHGRVGSLLEIGTGFHPELTGRENLYLYGAILGMTRAEIGRNFDDIVQFAGVGKFMDTPVKRFSSGMEVRLAFAVAAHLEPEVLLVDEVLAVGDHEFQKRSLGKMEEVAGQGRTVLFVTHNMALVERMCDRAILLSDGRVVADGAPREVISNYLTTGLVQLGERSWRELRNAPGDEVVRLKAVRALTAAGEVANEFGVRDSFSLEVEFSVLQPNHVLAAGFNVYNESGNMLFTAMDFQSDAWQEHPRAVGLHRSRCVIPGDLLNEGRITVNPSVTSHHVQHATERNALMIHIVDDLRPGGARGPYTRAWPSAAVRPRLRWSTQYEPMLAPEPPPMP